MLLDGGVFVGICGGVLFCGEDSFVEVTPVLGLPVDDELYGWCRQQVERPLRQAMERRARVKVGRPRMAESRGVDPFLFMAEYLVWKATPHAWRPAEWPRTEAAFCERLGARITMLLWYRRMAGFDRLVRRAKKFQPGSNERIMDARNVAHQMVLAQPEIEPRFRDARWLTETAKIEGMTRPAALVQIQNNQNILALDARDAEAQITDALEYFRGKGRMLPPNTRVPDAELEPERAEGVAAVEGQAVR